MINSLIPVFFLQLKFELLSEPFPSYKYELLGLGAQARMAYMPDIG